MVERSMLALLFAMRHEVIVTAEAERELVSFEWE